MMGQVPVASLSTAHICGFIAKRAGVAGVKLAADLSALSSVLKWAQLNKNISVDEDLAAAAWRGLKHKRLPAWSLQRTGISKEAELARIIAQLNGNPRQQIPVGQIDQFAAVSAMRLGKIC